MAALNRGEQMVTLGTASNGTSLLLYGISVGYPQDRGYPMPDGQQCTALVVGIPIARLNEALSLSVNSDLIFTHIIRDDGSFCLLYTSRCV